MLEQELAALEEKGRKIEVLIEKGDLKKARWHLKRLEGSMWVQDAIRIATPLWARIFIQERNFDEAFAHIAENLCYVWGYPETLELARMKNPVVGRKTRLFQLAITGGIACIAMFTQFGPEYICRSLVAAESEERALAYLFELVHFRLRENIRILEVKSHRLPNAVRHEGVVYLEPFTKGEIDEGQIC